MSENSQYVLKMKISIHCGEHRKNEKTTRAGISGSSLCEGKLKV